MLGRQGCKELHPLNKGELRGLWQTWKMVDIRGLLETLVVIGLFRMSCDMKHWERTSTLFFGEEPVVYIHREDDAQFPCSEDNPDYRAYLAWVAEGNTAEEWNPNGNQ